MKEYEACMNDLNFTMIIVFNEQRRIDNDILVDTLAEMIKDTKVSLYQEICHIKNKLEKTKDSIQQIDPFLLKDPSLSRRSDRRGKLEQIINKVYKDFIEVACKSRDLKDQRFRRELLILGKLDESQNIEKFYGLSEVDGKEVMIFEWTEMGNLKEVYMKEYSVGIFHNDIRCENIMMSRFMEPKLANFQFAVQHNDNEKNIAINQPTDVVNWMPPEKMHKLFTESGNPNQVPYNQKCEIFSFGMLIWELAYQKIPYSNMKYNDIVVHVTRGNREICDNFLDSENKIIHESFLDIIQHAWKEVPEERINIHVLSSKLLELV
ncbi:kinase-like protein [Gigaspora margarita]|uniref:Kinase-like protein n=1 Tax=Gigaspora margarita TaxID=4874 RepID=A0A8H4B128_GIGMA|nr:kinase-like protein [Gigaspora margarita]